MARFSDKVVLVTGGSTGIGRASCLAFAAEGAKLMIGDIDSRGAGLAVEINQSGGTAEFTEVDVISRAAVDALVESTVKKFGGLDCAFNNAGILPPTVNLHEVEDENFDRIMAVDVKGVFNAMRAEIEHMLDSGGGAIVNTASIAGVIADPGMSAYVAAKHAVVGLTKAAAIEYAAKGIRINAIAPGLIQTPMTQRWLDDPDFKQMMINGIPAGRPGQPEEIAGTVLHLCSNEASFSNGQICILDGGQTAH